MGLAPARPDRRTARAITIQHSKLKGRALALAHAGAAEGGYYATDQKPEKSSFCGFSVVYTGSMGGITEAFKFFLRLRHA
jgi:hypothetical protein